MAEVDWLLFGAVAVAAISLAYVLGERFREHVTHRTARALPLRTVPPERREATDGEKRPKPQTTEQGLAKLDYEEDDDIDPTRVGGKAADGARVVYQPPIKRIVYDEDADANDPTKVEPLFLIHASAQTDRGLRRKRNEDSLLVMEGTSLFAIADGMGGYRGGELASQLAVKTIASAFEDKVFEGEPHDGIPRDATNLARALQMANAAILETATRQKELRGMGTTVCAAQFSPNKRRVVIAHVGDSRCYRLRRGKLVQITEDHTMADLGVTGRDAAALSRAVGIWPTVPMDIVLGVPDPGDSYLLCSDGLTKMLRDEEIAEVLTADDTPTRAVDRLIALANAAGGKDNVTVILVRVLPPSAPKPASPASPAPVSGG